MNGGAAHLVRRLPRLVATLLAVFQRVLSVRETVDASVEKVVVTCSP